MKRTQGDAIIDYLKRGNSLTALQCLDMFGCMRLASRISDLRKEGFDISSEIVRDARTGKRYASYRLKTKETAGQMEMVIPNKERMLI